MLSPDFKEFVELLIKHQAEYLIVGGYAVSIHGHPRYTGDLDIWLNPTQENATRILKTVNEFGLQALNLKNEDFLKEGNIVQIGYPPLRIDLMTQIDGVNFKECFANRKIVAIDELEVNFIGYQDLLQNKKASGRARDMDDIENLT